MKSGPTGTSHPPAARRAWTQEREIGLLAQRQTPARPPAALRTGRWAGGSLDSSSSMRSMVSVPAVVADDGGEPLEAHPFVHRVRDLFGVGRHLFPGAPVDDDGLLGAEAAGGASGIHRRVAAAVDGHPPAQGDASRRRRGLATGPPHRGCAPSPRPGCRRAARAGRPRPGRRRRSPRTARARLRSSTGASALDLDAEGDDAVDLGRHHVPGKAVGGNSVTHHPARERRGLVDDDFVSEKPEVVGGGHAARARIRPPARGVRSEAARESGSQPSSRARSPRKRSMALMPTASSIGRPVAGGLAGVEAGPPHDGGEGVDPHDLRARRPRRSRPRPGTANAGCSRRRGRRRCTEAAGPRTPGARSASCRSCWPGWTRPRA